MTPKVEVSLVQFSVFQCRKFSRDRWVNEDPYHRGSSAKERAVVAYYLASTPEFFVHKTDLVEIAWELAGKSDITLLTRRAKFDPVRFSYLARKYQKYISAVELFHRGILE